MFGPIWYSSNSLLECAECIDSVSLCVHFHFESKKLNTTEPKIMSLWAAVVNLTISAPIHINSKIHITYVYLVLQTTSPTHWTLPPGIPPSTCGRCYHSRCAPSMTQMSLPQPMMLQSCPSHGPTQMISRKRGKEEVRRWASGENLVRICKGKCNMIKVIWNLSLVSRVCTNSSLIVTVPRLSILQMFW